MPDSKFFKKTREYKVRELADVTDCEIIGNPELLIYNIATLKSATKQDISFLNNDKYIDMFKSSQAGACIAKKEDVAIAPHSMTLLITDKPYAAWARVISKFYPDQEFAHTISEQAIIDKSAIISPTCSIAAGAIIGGYAEIGHNCQIGHNVYIGDGVIVGENTYIGSNASLQYSIIGKDCIIHPGVRIGQDGFGIAGVKHKLIKVKQLGRVLIGNNVEIGANTCIDRGALEDTTIGDNTKIDNLVQIAHNVVIGKNCIIVAQVGIAGSTQIEDGVIFGGQSGVAGHIKIGGGAMIAAQSGVIQDVDANAVVGGTPAVDIKQWHRQTIMLKKMAQSKSNQFRENNVTYR